MQCSKICNEITKHGLHDRLQPRHALLMIRNQLLELWSFGKPSNCDRVHSRSRPGNLLRYASEIHHLRKC